MTVSNRLLFIISSIRNPCGCTGYTVGQTISIYIPSSAKTRTTVLRFKQESHSGSGTAEWAIDRVLLTSDTVGSATHVSMFSDNFDVAPLIPYHASATS